MKQALLTFVLAALTFGGYAQLQITEEIKEPVKRSTTDVRVNIFWPGLQVETQLVDDYSIVFDFAVGGFGEIESSELMFYSGNIQARYYYNFIDRARRGESIYGFTGNYMALGLHYLKPISEDESAVIGSIQWGFQRRFRNGMYINFNIGPAIWSVPESTMILPWGDFTFGFSLTK